MIVCSLLNCAVAGDHLIGCRYVGLGCNAERLHSARRLGADAFADQETHNILHRPSSAAFLVRHATPLRDHVRQRARAARLARRDRKRCVRACRAPTTSVRRALADTHVVAAVVVSVSVSVSVDTDDVESARGRLAANASSQSARRQLHCVDVDELDDDGSSWRARWQWRRRPRRPERATDGRVSCAVRQMERPATSETRRASLCAVRNRARDARLRQRCGTAARRRRQ